MSMRSNPQLRALAQNYNDQGFDPVDSVRRALEDLFPTLPGESLTYPGVGTWKMGEERLSFTISDNLRSRRAVPGQMAGKISNSDEDVRMRPSPSCCTCPGPIQSRRTPLALFPAVSGRMGCW